MSGERGLEEKLAATAHGLVREIAQRLDFAGVAEALSQLEQAGRRDRASLEVTSAVPLTDTERTRLETGIRARMGPDIPFSYRVDPTILGGLIVRAGDRYIDGSVAARLGQLRQTLTGS